MTDSVAIIGMACVFPKAPNLRVFWENILGKVDAIDDPPVEWGADAVYDPTSLANDRIYCKRGGYLGSLARFNPLEYGVMPRAVDGGEPEHFLALQVAHEALADAGYLRRGFPRERTEVILGRGTYVNRGTISVFQHAISVNQVIAIVHALHPDYPAERLEDLKRELKAQLPPFNAETAPSLSHSVMCGRIANRLDLMGAAYTVDAACSSSLIAVEQGVTDLLSGKCDLVLAGGVQISTTFPITMVFCQLGALSRKGQSAPFSPDADGLLLGEGIGIVVLKRREDAERDHDRMYALVKSVGIASDGRAVGVLAPRVEGEILAMRRAYDAAGISPQTIGLVEAHGTGTPIGDATELEALDRVFGRRVGQVPTCALGSVKSMIGHCIPAAGVAGLIKASLALYHKVLPPTLHARAHPKLAESVLFLNGETRPWIHSGPDPRRAAVSAFGFGGINTHAILEEVPAAAPLTNLHARRQSELFLVAGGSREEIRSKAARLRQYLATSPAIALDTVAYTLNCPFPEPGTLRLAIVADSNEELDRKLAYALERLNDPTCDRIREVGGIYFFQARLAETGKIAFMFPGEGAQYPDMLKDLCLHFSEARQWFDVMDSAFQDHPRGFLPSQVIFPVPEAGEAGKGAERLWHMDSAIEAVFTANQAMHALLVSLGLKPDAVVGHSTGEYSALLVSGTVRLDGRGELIRYVQEGNRVTESAVEASLVPAGQLLTVGPAERTVLEDIVRRADGSLYLAMDNCPHQIVLAGEEGAIAEAQADLRRRGAICQPLPFRRAYHTPLYAPVSEKLREHFGAVQFCPADIPIYSCSTAAPFPSDPEAAREVAVGQWSRPVRFRETVERMYADGVRLFVEAGPRGNLTAFVDDILRGRPYLAVASNVPRRSGVTQLQHVLGILAAHGAALRLEPLYEGRGTERFAPDCIWSGARQAPPATASIPLALGLPILRPPPQLSQAPSPASSLMAPAVSLDAPTLGSGATQVLPTAPAGTPAVEAAPVVSRPIASAQMEHRPPRDRAMAEYLHTMESFLVTQEEVLRAAIRARQADHPGTTHARPVIGSSPPTRPPVRIPMGTPAGHADVGRPPSGSSSGPPDPDTLHAAPTPASGRATPARYVGCSLPFVDQILREVPGEEVVVLRTLDRRDDLFLEDHTLGPNVSDVDPTLSALPVLPLALTIEMMAEAASLLFPGQPVTAIRSLRAFRWITVPESPVAIQGRARRLSTVPPEISVELEEASATAPGALLARAVVCFGASGPTTEPPLRLDQTRPASWRTEELYAAGLRHGMFHGPRFQAVAAMTGVGEQGAEATLRLLTADHWFRSNRPGPLLTEASLVDAAGQVVGFWAADCLPHSFVVFPIGCEALWFHPSRTPLNGQTTCRVHLRAIEESLIRSDFEVTTADGSVRIRAVNWEDRRFDLPDQFYAYRLNPKEVIASRLVPDALAPGDAHDRSQVCLLALPDGFLEADAGIWREGLAHVALSRAERKTWQNLQGPERRRTEWLLGRVAAKDAVRCWLQKHHAIAVFPADIEITTGPHGEPGASGWWANRTGAPRISLAHTAGVAAAIATGADQCVGVGIDIEARRRLGSGFERIAFPGLDWARLVPDETEPSPEWLLRLWCAKEAVGKAFGQGLAGNPANFRIVRVDREIGTVALDVDARPAGVPPTGTSQAFDAHTVCLGDLIWATAWRPKI